MPRASERVARHPTGAIPVSVHKPARAPCAGCGVHFNRQVNELLHEEAYFLNHAPSCDDAAHGEV
jgi:hypothetical protein